MTRPASHMPHVDQIVLVLLLAGLIASIAHPWRRGLRRGRLTVAAFALFFGHMLTTMLTFHSVDVLWALSHRLKNMHGATFTYDWRTYSLLLFGALLVFLGQRLVRTALALVRGEADARATYLRHLGVVLAIVLPIIPIHAFFGVLISGVAGLTLLAVTLGGLGAPRAVQVAIAGD